MKEHKQNSVRAISFTAALLLIAAGAFSAVRIAERTRTAALYDADRKLFLHIAEEADNAARIAARIAGSESPDTTDLLALCRVCSAIVSSAALHSDTTYIAGTAQLYASAQARAEHALTAKDSTDAIPVWLSTCMADAASLLSDTAVLFIESEGGDLPNDALPLLDALSTLCAAFSPDPLKVFTADSTHTAYRFDKESTHTERELWDNLDLALGETAELFVSLDMPSAEEASANDARCVFLCKNGFAELSLRGGHLLHYALYPTQAASGEAATERLSSVDLEERRDAFLARNGTPVRLLSLYSEKEAHGLHYYTFTRKGDDIPCLTVGVRMTDGDVFYFDGELFYHR